MRGLKTFADLQVLVNSVREEMNYEFAQIGLW